MTPEIADLKKKLQKAIDEKDIQEIAELIFDIKANDYHKSHIDIRLAEKLVYGSDDEEWLPLIRCSLFPTQFHY